MTHPETENPPCPVEIPHPRVEAARSLKLSGVWILRCAGWVGMPAVLLAASWSVGISDRAASAAVEAVGLAAGPAEVVAASAELPQVLPRRLAETGLYAAARPGELREEALFYVPQYPLWSDGAHKKRWLVLPPGANIDGSKADHWEFPAGTRFFKEFSCEGKVETRMIEKRADGSYGYATYVWNEEQDEAALTSPQGAVIQGKQTGGEPYSIPAEGECRACHEGRTTSPILGFGALQLSPERDPLAAHADQLPADAVDLRVLLQRSLLEGYPQSALFPRIAAPSPEARAAAGYLFGNCAHCHNAEGPLADVGLNFDQSVVDGDSYARMRDSALAETQLFQLRGSTHSRRAIPGDAEHSVITVRMNARDPVAQMPPLGTQRVDAEGTRLVTDWITSYLQ